MLRMGTPAASAASIISATIPVGACILAFNPKAIDTAARSTQRFEYGAPSISQFAHNGLGRFLIAPNSTFRAIFHGYAKVFEAVAYLVGERPLLGGAQIGAHFDEQFDKWFGRNAAAASSR